MREDCREEREQREYFNHKGSVFVINTKRDKIKLYGGVSNQSRD